MLNTYRLPDDDVVCLSLLIETAQQFGASPVFVSTVDEYPSLHFTTHDFLKDCEGGCEEFAIRFFSSDGKYLGSFYVVLGNGDYTTIADYGVNDWTTEVDKALTAKIEAKTEEE